MRAAAGREDHREGEKLALERVETEAQRLAPESTRNSSSSAMSGAAEFATCMRTLVSPTRRT